MSGVRARRAGVRALIVLGSLGLGASGAAAQRLAGDDPALRAIWDEAMNRSSLEPLAQALLDSIGPRLTGSPGMQRAQDWAVSLLRSWGADARLDRYGTWEGWERGVSHIDLVAPRARALEGSLMAWSPGTGGRPVEAPVVALPPLSSPEEWHAFLASARGRWVMLSFPQPTCRPDDQWVEFSVDASVRRMAQGRQEAEERWIQSLRIAATGSGLAGIHAQLETAGATGIITSDWPGTPGTTRMSEAFNRGTPTLGLSCEDYGLVYRLATNGQRPVVRVAADATSLGEVPVFNVIGEIRGAERPDEYVVLSAHFDSWDGASGATDNGAGSLLMLETLRVLREVYPRPRRTLLIGLWSGEEQGLVGSGAFGEDHPEVVSGIQAVFNQDSGTGRINRISASGFVDGADALTKWLSRVPEEVKRSVELELPGDPRAAGSDYASFVCRGAPTFPLGTLSWDYTSHTWHSNRDTYDKLVFDDLRNNVVLTASLAYLASEEPERVGRTRRAVITDRNGAPGEWPSCRPVPRASPRAQSGNR